MFIILPKRLAQQSWVSLVIVVLTDDHLKPTPPRLRIHFYKLYNKNKSGGKGVTGPQNKLYEGKKKPSKT